MDFIDSKQGNYTKTVQKINYTIVSGVTKPFRNIYSQQTTTADVLDIQNIWFIVQLLLKLYSACGHLILSDKINQEATERQNPLYFPHNKTPIYSFSCFPQNVFTRFWKEPIYNKTALGSAPWGPAVCFCRLPSALRVRRDLSFSRKLKTEDLTRCEICSWLCFSSSLRRFCRFAPRTWEPTFVFTSTAKSSKSTRLSGWPATGACERWPWSSRPSTAPLVTSSTTPEKAWTASASWCRGRWRSSRTTKWWPF